MEKSRIQGCGDFWGLGVVGRVMTGGGGDGLKGKFNGCTELVDFN